MNGTANERDLERAEEELGALLQLAYSGEKAAAFAYRGHARSVRDPEERSRILAIEEEEWQHRREVGEMLAALGLEPDPGRERRAAAIGRTLAVLCRLGGWLAPMIGAGALESRNIGEYETAARHAGDCGRDAWVEPLIVMAEVEWEHERYFRERVQSHWLGRRLPLWRTPAPKASLRASLASHEPLDPRNATPLAATKGEGTR